VFALRISNDRDQEIVKSAIADTSAGLLEFLSALGQREAIAFGDGVTLPVRIKFDELPAHAMPRSSSARFTEMWQKSVGDEGFLDSIVDRWRNASASAADTLQSASLFAESVNLPVNVAEPPAPAVCEDRRPRRPNPPAPCAPCARNCTSAERALAARSRLGPARFEPLTPPRRPALARGAAALLMVRSVVVRPNR